jgi:hypothetical protein
MSHSSRDFAFVLWSFPRLKLFRECPQNIGMLSMREGSAVEGGFS